MKITYIQYPEIDKGRWDRCINNSVNGLVYGYSWYLDMTMKNWDALVLDDYAAVMPLPYYQRLGIFAVIQPQFALQLGVFSTLSIYPKMVDVFIKTIPSKFKYIDYNLNTYNRADNLKIVHKQLITHQLDLISPYANLSSKYNHFVGQDLWHARHNKIQIIKQLNLKELLVLYKDTATEPVTFDQLDILRKIIPFCINNNLGEIYAAYDENNMLVAAAFFIKSHQKNILLISAESNDGRDFGALTAIIDRYIGSNAE